MMNVRRALLFAAAAALSIGGVLAAQASVASDRILTSIAFDQPPAVVADAPAQRLVVFTDAVSRWSGGGAAEAHVLDEAGQVISTVPIGPRPSQSLVDPATGHIFVLTAGTPGTADSFFTSGVYLSALDPTHAVVLHTTNLQSAQAPGAPSGGPRFFGGGRPPTSRPPPWLRSYQSASALSGQGSMALDASHRRLFVASGGNGGGFFGGGFLASNGPAQLTVLNADTLAVIRSLPLPVGVTALAVDPTTARLFMVDRTGMLRILDARTLAPVASRHVSGGSAQIAVDARTGRVFVLDAAAGTVTTLDGRRGTILARASVMPGATGMQVDERAGHVFVESAGAAGFALQRAGPGSVAMLDAGSGRLLRTLQVGPLPFAAAVDAVHHRLFVSSFSADGDPGSGQVQVIDTVHGALLRAIAVPTGAFSLAEDPRRERLAVAGLSGTLQPSPWSNTVDSARALVGPAAPTPTPAALQGSWDGSGAVSVVSFGN